MNKMHLLVAIAVIQSFVAESKEYTFLPQLNNKTSERCNAVEGGRFLPGDLEFACDDLEKVLGMKSGSYENITGTDYLRLPYDKKHMSILKEKFRVILSDEDVATKYREYREFKALADNLEQEKKTREEKAKAEYKAKRAQEKLTTF